MNKNPQIKSTTTTSRNFRYEKDGTFLDFTLRTDIKGQLKLYREFLTQALKDVGEEIDKR